MKLPNKLRIMGNEWTLYISHIPEELNGYATWDSDNWSIHIEKSMPDYNKMSALWHEIMEIIAWGYGYNRKTKHSEWDGMVELSHEAYTVVMDTFHDIIMRYSLYV